MNEVVFKLEQFEGPLDLLLHLISKHKLDIFDIEITKLLEQYLCYIDEMNSNDFEYAGEFLEMAARLIYIKTVSLLPKPNEAEELKQELQGVLIEYSLCKRASEMLKDEFIGNDIYVRQPMKIKVSAEYNRQHDKYELIKAINGIKSKILKEENNQNVEDKLGNIVRKKMVSVTTKVVFILRKLYTAGVALMDSLYDGITDRSERVATFLAVLELAKSGRIVISEDNSEIYFQRRNHKNTA